MRRIDTNDMDMVMSIKGKGNSRRYAFNDFSDRVNARNPIAKILKDRIKQNKNQKTMPKLMEGSKALMSLKGSMRKVQLIKMPSTGERVHCNTTHIFDGENWTMLWGIIPISQVKKHYPSVRELMYSKDNEKFGDLFMAAGNVH